MNCFLGNKKIYNYINDKTFELVILSSFDFGNEEA